MISTFYSYKGGVGRSMALANVADVFARRGLRTAMIDFDLEAPGLERFFLPDPTPVRRNRGLLDLLLAYKQAMSGAPGEGEAEFRRLESFVVPIYNQLPSGGTLDLLPAGQRADDEQLSTYAYHLRTFDWQEFYFDWMGELFFQWLRRELLNRYDAILVDSRTGMTEMGGVCAYQLADHLVMFCAANAQNVQGTRDIIRNFQSPRVLALRKDRPLDVVVVPARVQQNSADVERFRTEFEKSFTPYTPEPLVRSERAMWDLMLPYEAAYAFEERVADGGELKEAFARLAETVALLAPEGSRLRALAQEAPREQELPEPEYDPTQRFAGYDAFLTCAAQDQASALRLATALTNRDLKVWADPWYLAPDHEVVERALALSRAFVVLVGRTGHGARTQQMIIRRSVAARDDLRVIPVLLPGASPDSIPELLRDRVTVDLRASLDDEEALDALAAAVRADVSTPARQTDEESPFKGLASYQEDDAPLFFGRTEEVETSVRLLLERNLVTIAGPSGSGKTSLVQAGIIPRLRAEVAGLKVVSMRPTADPVADLALALRTVLDMDVTAQTLRESPSSLSALIRRTAVPVLLVVDQFEEVWTLAKSSARSLFLETLRWAIGPCRAILVLRSDYVTVVVADGLHDLVSSTVDLQPLSRVALYEVITGPARLRGVAFEPGLAERLVDDAEGAIAPLPALQAVLIHLWKRRQRGFLTHEEYDRLGGVAAALSASAEMVFARLTAEGQARARSLLLRMVTANGVRRFMPVDELAAAERETLDALVRAALVVIEERGATLAHDALIHHWPRLKEWIAESQETIRLRAKIEEAAKDWELNGRPSDYLYRGRLLERAERLARLHPEMLSALDHEFMRASRAGSGAWFLRWFLGKR